MSYRFTNTDKWTDLWFSNLKQLEMLLFMYLCDNCDIAGFVEPNYKRWASDLNSNIETIKGAIVELKRGLIYSKDTDLIFIRNFIKHQKNYPLNENNNAHAGILKRLNENLYKFDFQSINDYFEGANEGLNSPIGKGRGKGNGNIPIWKTDFEIYKQNCRDAFEKLKNDTTWLRLQSSYYKNIDIIKSIEKNFVNYWSTELGWQNKIKSGSIEINWKTTIGNSLKYKENRVYKEDKE